MKVQRVYIDTSVLGGCFDPEFAPWSNGLMKDFRLGNYNPIVSEMVAAEVKNAPEYVQSVYADLIDLGAERLATNDQVVELANAYQDRSILTPKYYDDGLHVALATVHEVDLIASWNFMHIVPYDKIRRFAAANIDLGYKPIQIHSPREVTNYEVITYEEAIR